MRDIIIIIIIIIIIVVVIIIIIIAATGLSPSGSNLHSSGVWLEFVSCQILGSHSGNCVGYSLLECDTIQSDHYQCFGAIFCLLVQKRSKELVLLRF
jgi:hypothetical protein